MTTLQIIVELTSFSKKLIENISKDIDLNTANCLDLTFIEHYT